MRHLLVALSLLVGSVSSAGAQVSVGIDIGVRVPVYPDLVPVPGYPVYYDPRADSNYFFYDGVYWVFHEDGWYASSWYDGPWTLVRPERVPVYVLRVPVRYYRRPPPFFGGWREDAPPRWGEHWGHGWERRHRGWDRWDQRAVPRPAPLPVYQRDYSGDRYPRAWDQQRSIRSESYRYTPRETFAREAFQERGVPRGPRGEPQRMGPGPQREGFGPRRMGPGPQHEGFGPRREGHGPQREGFEPRREGPGPQRAGPGPQQPHDGGRMRRPGERDDRREDRREEHDRDRR